MKLRDAVKQARSELIDIPGVEGVGTGEDAVLVYVSDPSAESSLPQSLGGFAIQIVESSVIDASPEESRPRYTIRLGSLKDFREPRGEYRALILGSLTFVQTYIITLSFRALAADDYWTVFITDVIYALCAFSILKRVVAASSNREMFAYVVGVSGGSQVGMHSYHFSCRC